jgi:hypothetical protein
MTKTDRLIRDILRAGFVLAITASAIVLAYQFFLQCCVSR